MASTVREFKCPCCSGYIEFDTKAQKMKCPYCDTEFDLDTLNEYDADLKEEAPDSMEWTSPEHTWEGEETDGMATYVCPSCAGEIITEVTSAATLCPFCGNPVVFKGNLSGELKPDLVIPFKLDKKAAVKAFSDHLCGKWLLPRVFKNQNHLDEIKGIYVPFWLFNADADATMRFRASRTRHWSDSKYMYKETSYYSVVRSGSLGFDKVPVDGSRKMPDDLMESLEPFDYREAVDFQTAYLSGFLADRYDVPSTECTERSNEMVKHSTESTLAATVRGYSTVVPEYTSVTLSDGKTLYALLPVWLLNTTWNGKQYTFAMNGQTGKFVGNLPTDMAAYHKWLWGLTAAVSAGVIGLSLLFHFLLGG